FEAYQRDEYNCPGNVCGTGLCYITISPGNTGFNVGGTPCA
ncbi:unnamed protein product, partial [Rotaria sordida]